MRRLADAGLTTREACGNSVRNITACPYAGVAADELFDVTPYAEALTRYLAAASAQLDAAAQVQDRLRRLRRRSHRARAINDLGFRAALGAGRRARLPRDRRRRHGDHVHVGAACSTSSCRRREMLRRRRSDAARVPPARRLPAQAAQPHEVPDQDARLGRAGARSTSASWPACRLRGGVPPLDIDHAAGRSRAGLGRGPSRRRPDDDRVARRGGAGRAARASCRRSCRCCSAGDEAYARWRATNVRPQKQSATSIVDGHGAARRPDRASRCACSPSWRAAYGDGTVRVTTDQNLRVPLGADRRRARSSIARLAAAGLGLAERRHDRRRRELPGRRVVPARGDAVARARPAARAIICARGPISIAAADGARIKISGCPNGCGQHHIATIGFQGSVRTVGGARRAAVLRDGRRRRHETTAPTFAPAAPRRSRRAAFPTSSSG